MALYLRTQLPELDAPLAAHLASHYGSLAQEVLAPAVEDPDLLRPLHADGPDIAAQVPYARDSEWAVRTEDVVRRRTTLALRGLDDPETVGHVTAVLAGQLPHRWSADMANADISQGLSLHRDCPP